MTESLLVQVREKQAQATRAELRRWQAAGLPKAKRERARLARELSQLIAEQRTHLANDERMLHDLIQWSVGRAPQDIDQINALLQGYLGLVIDLCALLRSMARRFSVAGHPVEGAASLDSLIAERKRWCDDLPEQLAMASGPIHSKLEERVGRALKTPPQATDWRSVCE